MSHSRSCGAAVAETQLRSQCSLISERTSAVAEPVLRLTVTVTVTVTERERVSEQKSESESDKRGCCVIICIVNYSCRGLVFAEHMADNCRGFA